MKAIEGLDLVQALNIAEAAHRSDRLSAISNAIRNQLNIRESARIKAAQLETEIKKAREAVARSEETIEKIKAGDWSAIPEPKKEKPGD